MEPNDPRVRALGRRLLAARARLLLENPFYGLLLMHCTFRLTDDADEVDTACVNARGTITFNADFAESVTDSELTYVMQHEVLHCALGHLRRRGTRKPFLFNVAADIIVNSNIMHSAGDDISAITLACEGGEPLHLAPDGTPGWQHTAEEVYAMLPTAFPDVLPPGAGSGHGDSCKSPGASHEERAGWDRHEEGGDPDGGSKDGEAWQWDQWDQWLMDAAEAMRVRDPSNSRGTIPACAERRIEELKVPTQNWRELLADFVQEEVNDYTFCTPDRRFPYSPFVLPSFSDAEAAVRGVVFAVDASGSMSDEELAAVFSEVAGAVTQFGGKLSGWIMFFDADAYMPTEFDCTEDVVSAKPLGGGGTDFEAIFAGTEKWLAGEGVVCIVVLTDGYAPYPDESVAGGVPVLWLVSGDGPLPEWGRVAKLTGLRQRP